MQLQTAQLGVIDVNEADIIVFPEGIPGFENSKRFILVGKDSNQACFFWLQSVDQPELCFVVTDPFMIYDDYGVDVEDEDVVLLGIDDVNSILTLAIAVIPEDISQARVNLKAPVLINVEKKLGKQIIQKDENLPIRYYLCRNA